jgi:hypothetical protein
VRAVRLFISLVHFGTGPVNVGLTIHVDHVYPIGVEPFARSCDVEQMQKTRGAGDRSDGVLSPVLGTSLWANRWTTGTGLVRAFLPFGWPLPDLPAPLWR